MKVGPCGTRLSSEQPRWRVSIFGHIDVVFASDLVDLDSKQRVCNFGATTAVTHAPLLHLSRNAAVAKETPGKRWSRAGTKAGVNGGGANSATSFSSSNECFVHFVLNGVVVVIEAGPTCFSISRVT